jgi:hypothetical protein
MFEPWYGFRFFQRLTMWSPTWLSFSCTVVLLLVPVGWWCVWGESFLSLTGRVPAEILVVESWIGRAAVRAAAAEFELHGYRYIVTAGGLATGKGWEEEGWSYAERAGRELVQAGIPEDRIIVATATNSESQRTYQSAVAVLTALRARNLRPVAINVFTFGPHARRSRLIFAKVLGLRTQVGIIGWTPSDDRHVPWWQSSDRARELLTETAGYLYEALLNSGRSSSFPGETHP